MGQKPGAWCGVCEAQRLDSGSGAPGREGNADVSTTEKVLKSRRRRRPPVCVGLGQAESCGRGPHTHPS